MEISTGTGLPKYYSTGKISGQAEIAVGTDGIYVTFYLQPAVLPQLTTADWSVISNMAF